MKILIIGGAGFIGASIASRLSRDADNKITIADNYFRGKKDDYLSEITTKENVKLIECDLTKETEFFKLDTTYDHIYMLASVVGVEYTEKMPQEIIRINTQLIMNTLEWLKTIKVKKVLFTSTSECYAGTIEVLENQIPSSETIPLCIGDIKNPRFTYAVTKMLGEAGLIHYANAFGFNATIVRYHNVYGPRMGFKHVIPQVVMRFLDGEKPFRIFGGTQTRAFNFIDDAVNGTIGAMNSDKTNGEIIHIGDMRSEITIEELVKFIGKSLEYDGEYVIDQPPEGSVNRRCPDTTKAYELFGYEPKMDWQTGVIQTVNWYKEYIEKDGVIYE